MLHYLGWIYALMLYVPLCYGCDAVSQGTIHHATSRVNFGIAWGIISSIVIGHFVYTAPHISVYWTIFLVLPTLAAIVSTLLLASSTPPASLSSHSKQEERVLKKGDNGARDYSLIERIAQSGQAEGVVGKNLRGCTSSSTCCKNDHQHETARLCPSCLVDKTQATTHCSRCGLCVIALDHHCGFVNNCVGRGNRRVFVLFTLSASFGCGLCAALFLYVQYVFYCSYIGNGLLNLLPVQACVAKSNLAFVVLTWLAIASSIWIGSICVSQLSLIASNTTSYLVMKGKHDGSCGLFSVQGIKSIILFFQSGSYTAVPLLRRTRGEGRHFGDDKGGGGGVADKKEEDVENTIQR